MYITEILLSLILLFLIFILVWAYKIRATLLYYFIGFSSNLNEISHRLKEIEERVVEYNREPHPFDDNPINDIRLKVYKINESIEEINKKLKPKN